MTTRNITAIAIKVLAIWLLVNVVLGFPVLANVAMSIQRDLGLGGHVGALYVSLFLASGLVGGTACFLLFRLSDSLLSSVSDSSADASGTLSQGFVLQVVGLFFIVSVVVDFPEVLYQFYTGLPYKDHDGVPVGLPYLVKLLALLFKLIIGVALLLGADKSRNFLLRLRGRV